MKPKISPHSGWDRNLHFANGHLELMVTLDVGPRILHLSTPGGQNVFKNYANELGGRGETEWMIRGGHRFWIAPEDLERTYHRDNHPVEHLENPATGEVVIESTQEVGGRILKTLGITVAPDAPRATIRHTARNIDSVPLEFSVWALSVMAPGGVEIIPQPPLGEHPRDLLPNRTMVLWPYTDMSDPRWRIGRDFFTLSQQPSLPPCKIGLAHRSGWIAYAMDHSLFVKTFEFLDGATYPDGGCNFETFTNSDMLEIESLGPLKTLAPGEEMTHIERWCILPLETPLRTDSDEALSKSIAPLLARTGLL
jgi:hypothetical protein